MIKILFVCLGNICRSPMAEFVFKELVKREKIENDFYISSAATSTEEIGNDIHYGTKNKLDKMNIPYKHHEAKQIKKEDYEQYITKIFNDKFSLQLSTEQGKLKKLEEDYEKYDFIIGMEDDNLVAIRRIVGEDKNKKIYKLLDFSSNVRDIADPWYTGNFDKTYDDILEGCTLLLEYIKKIYNI